LSGSVVTALEFSSVLRSAFSVLIRVVSAVTVTLSCMPPRASMRSTRFGLPAETDKAVCFSSLNPVSVAEMS